MSKKYFLIIFVFFAAFWGFAKTVTFEDANYSGTISYNETAMPGDAVFARLFVKINKNLRKKTQGELQALLELYNEEKKIEAARFYFLEPKQSKKSASQEMLAGIPLSTWLKNEGNFSLKISFTIDAEEAKSISLPLKIDSKKFIKETIILDAKNSAIKQDISAERLAQIAKLNSVLETINSDIYSLKPFTAPVTSTRRTAFFGDRRIFQYTDKKTSTTLHYGIDYGVPVGTNVMSCADGKVVMSEFRISTGWTIVIEHLPGLYSLYYHLNTLEAKEGKRVRQGEVIGTSGATGLATGPHLHWEVRLNAAAVNPDFFTKDFTF